MSIEHKDPQPVEILKQSIFASGEDTPLPLNELIQPPAEEPSTPNVIEVAIAESQITEVQESIAADTPEAITPESLRAAVEAEKLRLAEKISSQAS